MQAGEVQDWEAAGKQLMDEEQQAAAKAAAKKAKKLRQKLNKQPAQQQQPAADESSLQHSSDTDAHGNAGDKLQNTSLAHTQPHLLPAPSSHDSPKFSSEQSSLGQPLQPADLVTAMQNLGGPIGSTAETAGSTAGIARSTAANRIAGKDLLSFASPSSNAEQGAGQQEVPSTLQHIPSASTCSESVDDDNFLQELFKCPITKVSGHCR